MLAANGIVFRNACTSLISPACFISSESMTNGGFLDNFAFCIYCQIDHAYVYTLKILELPEELVHLLLNQVVALVGLHILDILLERGFALFRGSLRNLSDRFNGENRLHFQSKFTK